MSSEPIKIGIAELKVSLSPVKLITIGLGSCVAVCLWDPITKIGGMVHVMLPDSTLARNMFNDAKYADTGIKSLIEEMQKIGAHKNRLVAKIAGGAQMFTFKDNTDKMKIGERNVEAVKNQLILHKIKLLAEDVRGNYGRTIEFFTENGQLLVKSINKGDKVI